MAASGGCRRGSTGLIVPVATVRQLKAGLRRLLLVGLVLAQLWSAPVAAQTFSSEKHPFQLVSVAEGLNHPWSLAFLPNGDVLVSERAGRLRLIRDGQLRPEPVAGLPAMTVYGEAGLLDLALHPEFESNRQLFFTLAVPDSTQATSDPTPAKPGSTGSTTALARALFDGKRLSDVQILFIATPHTQERGHFGSRLAFDANGYLYMSVGDRSQPARAQDLKDAAGSVLRLQTDGKAPKDNPFGGTPGALPEIFTYGHRNIQGLTVHPRTGEIWVNEHGPQGGDELNRLLPGRNYGWPLVSAGLDETGQKIGEGVHRPPLEAPVRTWTPSFAPSGLTFYEGDAFPEWKGDLFMGGLVGRSLLRLTLKDGQVVQEERLLQDFGQRIRDVRSSPDGKLWLLTDAKSGQVLRLEPVTASSQ